MFKLDEALSTELSKAFDGLVYALLLLIPPGRVVSYSDIAKLINASPRRVAAALRRNTLPILIPCHRVVRKSGDLSGYSFFGGASFKKKLLELEGVTVQGNRVSKRYFYSEQLHSLLG